MWDHSQMFSHSFIERPPYLPTSIRSMKAETSAVSATHKAVQVFSVGKHLSFINAKTKASLHFIKLIECCLVHLPVKHYRLQEYKLVECCLREITVILPK